MKSAVFRIEVSQISLSLLRLLNSFRVSFLMGLTTITFMRQDWKKHRLGFMLPSLLYCYRLNTMWITKIDEIFINCFVFDTVVQFDFSIYFAIWLPCLLFSFSFLSGFLFRMSESSFYMFYVIFLIIWLDWIFCIRKVKYIVLYKSKSVLQGREVFSLLASLS